MKAELEDEKPVCPTRVGVNRIPVSRETSDGGLPHTRGGEPAVRSRHHGDLLSAPHAWG